MTKYIQDPKTGHMKGSLGDGKTRIPTPNDTELTSIEPATDTPDIAALYERFTVLTPPPADGANPHLYDILDKDEYEASLADGHIRTQTHPTLPYLIHNYTESCTWDNGWNESTLTCRGLITHAETGEVIARPFKKFFNSNQEQAPVFDLDQSVVVTDKKDGSLLISFPRPDGTLGLATRGSFASDQANWANEFYSRTYEGKFQPDPRYTYLFEGIVGWNRIVLDYADMEDLILLGAVDIRTGRNLHLDEARQGWTGPTTEIFPHTTLREVLEAPERENAEGFVLWDPDTDERVKVKYESYLALHKLLSNCTPKNIWGILSSGEDPEMAYMAAPDEFLGLVKETVATLNKQHTEIKTDALQSYTGLRTALDSEYGSGKWGRKEFAMQAVKNPHRAFLFRLLDEGSIDDMIWNMIKPSGEEPLRKVD